jgi:hypothetical protein
MGQSRFRPSPAMIVALIALFVSLGGVGYAAATIGSNDIKDNAILTRHIMNGAVTTSKLANQGVTTAKLARGAVKTARLADGSVNGNKVGPDTLSGYNIDESTLGQVGLATQAQTAFNALLLGGRDSSEYQRSCMNGAIAAHVYVKGSPTFPSTYTSSPALVLDPYNCKVSGSITAVQVKRTSAGSYFVDFPAIDPSNFIVASGNVTVDSGGGQGDDDVLTYKLVYDPAIGRTVYRIHTANATSATDWEFSFTVDG